MSARSAAAKSSPGHVQPGQQPAADAGRAQREALGQLGHAEPGRAARERGPGARHQPVAVGVGLDDRHHLGRPGPARAARRRCRGSRSGRSRRRRGGPRSPVWRSAGAVLIAAQSAGTRGSAPASRSATAAGTARSTASRRDRAARRWPVGRPDRARRPPWPRRRAGPGPRRAASPAMPASTSPDPAVASQPGPVARPCAPRSVGAGDQTVVAPLSRTVAPVSSLARRAWRSGSASTAARVDPRRRPRAVSSRASSPACGVSRVGAVRAAPASRPRPPASTTHGRSLGQRGSIAARWACRRGRRTSVSTPGPSTQACTRPGAGHDLGPAGPDQVGRGGRADVAHHPAAGLDGRAGAAAPRRRCTSSRRRRRRAPRASTCRPAGPGTGQSAATSARSSCSTAGSSPRRCGPSPMSTTRTLAGRPVGGRQEQAGLATPKVTVTSAQTCSPGVAPVSGSTPLGRSTATTRASSGTAPTSRAASSRSPGRPPMPSMPSTTTSARGRARPGSPCRRRDDPPAGRGQRGQAGLVRLVRDQHRVDPRPARGQPGTGPQRVAAVVAGADEQHQARAVHAAGQQLGDGDGERRRRPAA